MTLDQLIKSLVSVAYNMVEVERISLFMKDDITNELVCRESKELEDGFRVHLGKGIVGTVGFTGKSINIRDAHLDPRFDASQDLATGHRTLGLLCTPIKDNLDHTVGVIQLSNKLNEREFNEEDEELVHAFALEVAEVIKIKSLEASVSDILEGRNKSHWAAGLSSLIYQYNRQTQKQSDGDRAYSGPSTPHDEMPVSNPILTAKLLDLNFNVFDFTKDELIQILPQFLIYFGHTDTFSMNMKKMNKFFVEIASGYRESNPYHNFYHGAAVMQFSFYFLVKGSVSQILHFK